VTWKVANGVNSCFLKAICCGFTTTTGSVSDANVASKNELEVGSGSFQSGRITTRTR
jgi:hypothetical protein